MPQEKNRLELEDVRKRKQSEVLLVIRSWGDWKNLVLIFPYHTNLALKTPFGEVRIRPVRIFIGPSSTRFTCHRFPEDPIFPSAKPYPTSPLDPYSARTRSTEALSTCVTTSPAACPYSVSPSISYQIRCLLIPGCYGERRARYNQPFYPSGFRPFPSSFPTLLRVVPNVRHFPCFAGTTSTNSLVIKSQPKIFDHIMLTVRILFIPSVRPQVPVIAIRLPEKGISVKTSTKNRRFSMVCPLPTAVYSAPPDIWCQIIACLPIPLIMESTIFVASVVRVKGTSSALPSGPEARP